MDKRVTKSKKAITTAFIDLLSEKEYAKITITDIANRALVDRKTIYKYYENIDDILSEIEDTLVYDFDNLIKNIDLSISLKDPYVFFYNLTESLSNNYSFYKQLTNLKGNYRLTGKIIQNFIDKLKQEFKAKKIFKDEDVDYITTYLSTGMIAVYHNWISSEMKIPLKKFSKNISKLVYEGINIYMLPAK